MKTLAVVLAAVALCAVSVPSEGQQSEKQTTPFDVLVGRWSGGGTASRGSGNISFNMEIRKVDPQGNIDGTMAIQGARLGRRTFKAEQKGNAIHVVFESQTGATTFAGEFKAPDQINGTSSVTSAALQGRAASYAVTLTREK